MLMGGRNVVLFIKDTEFCQLEKGGLENEWGRIIARESVVQNGWDGEAALKESWHDQKGAKSSIK